MPTFDYKPRSLRDTVVRAAQTGDEVDKPPKIAPEEICTRCGHARWQHCYTRKVAKNRSALWVIEYGPHINRKIAWERTIGRAFPRERHLRPVVCRHFRAGQDFPCCNTTACARSGCTCAAFQSPFRKKKAATAKPASRKRTAKPEAQPQLDFESQDHPATPVT